MTTTPTTAKLATKENFLDILRTAAYAAHEAMQKNDDDGGTCNFDSCYIPRNRLSDKFIRDTAGNNAFVSSHFGRPVIFLGFTSGQGARRTRMAEAQRKALCDAGYEAHMYYQMD